MKVKVCGLRHGENIRDVVALEPDIIGLIFYAGSPRYAGGILDPGELEDLPSTVKKAGVFVNASIEELTTIYRKYKLDYAQLHGNESPAYCEALNRRGIPLIKAFSPVAGFDLHVLEQYVHYTRYFLFDTPVKSYGGSGRQFDWSVLDGYKLDHPFFLSGGIGPGDVENILSLRHSSLAGVDVNSRFETSPGLKDINNLATFLDKIKNIRNT